MLETVIVVFTLYAFLIALPDWVKSPNSDWFFERIDHHFAGINPDNYYTIKLLIPKCFRIYSSFSIFLF